MNRLYWVFAMIAVIVAVVYRYLKTPRGRRAALGAAPMGTYLRARDRGASAEEAIFEAIRVLRYREPWSALSDRELSAAASILATLRDPTLFTALVVEVEELRILDPIRDEDSLKQFVRGANSAGL